MSKQEILTYIKLIPIGILMTIAIAIGTLLFGMFSAVVWMASGDIRQGDNIIK